MLDKKNFYIDGKWVSPAYDHAEVTSLAAATIVYELTNLFAKT